MLELESTLSYSLPVDVGQSGLLEEFWSQPRDLESSVYRVTRLSVAKWRIGEQCILSATSRARQSSDRLSMLRLMQAASSDVAPRVYSELKICLVTDRTYVYNDDLQLSENLAYPILIEDRLSAEVKVSDSLNEHLLDVEDDTSDNNLGIWFVHRLSFRDGLVRVSIRATLNEYHEIAYALELETESSRGTVESVLERERRHEQLLTVFANFALPLLRKYWPLGLREDSCSPTLPAEVLDDCDFADLRRVRTGPSSVSSSAMFERAQAVLASDPAALIKLKYNGIREYAWYRDDALRIDGQSLSGGEINLSVFCGLFVYQAETLSQTRHVITEVAYVLDHRVLFDANGGGTLQRQIESPEHRPSREQCDPAIAFLLPATVERDDATHPWSDIACSLHSAETLARAEVFLRTCTQSHGSYVYPPPAQRKPAAMCDSATAHRVRLSLALLRLYGGADYIPAPPAAASYRLLTIFANIAKNAATAC